MENALLKTAIAVFFLSALTTQGLASVSPMGYPTKDTSEMTFLGIEYAQQTALPELPPSALRRMQFYSDKTVSSLISLSREDASGEELNDSTIVAFYKNVERMIDAGAKVGLDIDQVAAFFTAEVGVWNNGEVPVIIQGSDGSFDAQAMFHRVEINAAATSNTSTEVDYLALVNERGAIADNLINNSDTDDTVVAPPVVVEDVQRPPAIQVFWDRLIIETGSRKIRVQRGDTLAVYASAFYGNALRYRKIFQANQGILNSPNFLEVGQVVVIPE